MIDNVLNGEQGLSVRNKINSVIDKVNEGVAKKLESPVLINGVEFDGSANITLPFGLHVITENSKTGYGTSHRAANPANYGDIGTQAVDLSYNNNASIARGATGNYSIAAGDSCTASGYAATAMGNTCMASATGSTAMGSDCKARGNYSTSLGWGNDAQGPYSLTAGYICYTGNLCHGGIALGTGGVTSTSNEIAIGCRTSSVYQTKITTLAAKTTDTTPTFLRSDAGTSYTANQLTLGGTTYGSMWFKGTVIATGVNFSSQSWQDVSAVWEIQGLLTRKGNTSATLLTNSTVTPIFNDIPGTNITLSADTSNGTLKINVVGYSQTLGWTATIISTQASAS
jgi:hypothetical protein